jgi:hypothetical protein
VVKSELICALNEKLPERQVSDVELAVNCLLKHIEDGLGQQADQAIVKIRRSFYLRKLFLAGGFFCVFRHLSAGFGWRQHSKITCLLTPRMQPVNYLY